MPVLATNVPYRKAYIKKITELCGELSKDSKNANLKSVEDFYQFLKLEYVHQKADLLLLASGNIKAFWRDETSYVSLEFIGNKTVRVLIRVKYLKETATLRAISSFEGVKSYASSYGVSNILFTRPKRSRRRQRK